MQSWQSLVDEGRLAAWMDSRGLAAGPLKDVRPLHGGTQNVLLRFTRGEREFVLRRPPANPYMDGNRTMLREARVLAALAGTGVPHPALIALCDDVAVLGSIFYLMEPVNGFNATVSMPTLHATDPSMRKQMGHAMVDGALALASVDHVAAGLELRGDPATYFDRQIEQWRSQLESYGRYEGWPGPTALAGIQTIARWLGNNQPREFRAGILHGDYHLANVLYDFQGPGLAAIVDWELSTVGDPLLDLGWLIATWPDENGEGGTSRIVPWSGFPTVRELVQRYEERSSRDLSSIAWYGVLACYKLGIILEGTYARACSGEAARQTGDELHASALRLFERAARLMNGALL